MIALALLVALSMAAPASAQAPDAADFVLRPGATNLPPRVDELGRHLTPAGVDEVLAQANRPATPHGACSEPAFGAMPDRSRWYCFDPADSGDLERPDRVEWVPQGVTTSADAGSGREALLVSWYDKRTAPVKGVRVSFLDTATNRYRHVLLVYPTADGSYEILGRPQGGIHAGGIVWHGNRLYVVDTTRGIRVFDLRQMFDLGRSPAGDTSDATKIGRHGDTYHGFGYRYLLPQVGAWVNAAGPDDDGDFACEENGAPKFSSIALDAAERRLVTSEYCRTGALGRVARWPVDTDDLVAGADGTVRAADARRLPVQQVQGAVSHAGTWYLSRSRGADANGELIAATPGPDGSLRAGEPRRAGIGPEDLSYWPGRDELWTVTEHAGRRMLYGVPAGPPVD
jgi:hypothetical protein